MWSWQLFTHLIRRIHRRYIGCPPLNLIFNVCISLLNATVIYIVIYFHSDPLSDIFRPSDSERFCDIQLAAVAKNQLGFMGKLPTWQDPGMSQSPVRCQQQERIFWVLGAGSDYNILSICEYDKRYRSECSRCRDNWSLSKQLETLPGENSWQVEKYTKRICVRTGASWDRVAFPLCSGQSHWLIYNLIHGRQIPVSDRHCDLLACQRI